LYTKEELRDKDLTIEEFLGQDICNDPIVKNSKLTETEKTYFDTPITQDELDIAMKGSNQRSAPGIDGYPGKFINQFWYVFRDPLYKCMHESFRLGRLPDSFRTAVIKLLPKKGDISKMKNWRPISLLSNFYKIISRAINNRLNKITSRILSRAQKGFNKNRQGHEVLINIDQKIEYCKRHNIKGCIVAVDQHKAFDSVDKEFMKKTLEFFGFGQNFIQMIETIGNHRRACIKLNNEETTEFFDVSKGNTQGDCPSPVLYNFVAQLLLFKIELNVEIKSVTGIKTVNNVNGEINRDDHFYLESQNETDNNESFADDSNTVTIFEYDSLSELKRVLENFRHISGLKCNYEKTSILRIGNTEGQVEPRIYELGFEIVDNIKLLGFYLSNEGILVDRAMIKIEQNINNIVRFWKRFNLSLAGKIMVSKTLLISQLSYYVTILQPETEFITRIQETINQFVTEKLNIGKDRFYKSVNEGGLGLIPINEFMISTQVSWIKRSIDKTHDNWSYELKNIGGGNIINLTSEDSRITGKILGNIIKSYDLFKGEYSKISSNYKVVPLWKNQGFKIGRNAGAGLGEEFFEEDELNSINVFKNWTIESFKNGENWIELEDIRIRDNINLRQTSYRKIKDLITKITRKYGKNTGEGMDLATFFRSYKKGSKKIRLILTRKYENKKEGDFRQANTHFQVIGVDKPNTTILKVIYGSWNCSYLPNQIKTFLFKYTSNTLGTGSRITHINPEKDAGCTFCNIINIRPIPAETFLHIFWDCPTVNKTIMEISTYFLGFDIKKNEWFGLEFDINKTELYSLWIFLGVVKYAIWSNKLKKKLLNQNLIRNEVNFHLEYIFEAKPKFKLILNNLRQNIQHKRRG